MNSNFFKINWLDLFKAAILFFLTIVVQWAYAALHAAATGGDLPTWVQILAELKVAGITTGAYLLKQLFSGSDGVPFVRGDLDKKQLKRR